MVDVSIIIINYNYGKYLKRCLQSCFVQKNNCNLEVIVIDDGSTDNSLLLLEKIKKKNFKLFKTKNNGIEKSCNLGFKKSKGEFILRVDSDDYLKKNFIKKILPHLKKNYAFFYTDYFLVNSKGRVIKRKKLPKFNKKEIINRGDFLATGTVYKKAIIKKMGYYNEKIKNSGLENYALILKLIKNNYKGLHINKALFSHTRHESNLSVKNKCQIKRYGEQLFLNNKFNSYKINKNHPSIY